MLEITLTGRGPNTMSLALLDDLESQLERAGDEPILLTGAGAAFSAGLDLDDLAKADASAVERLLGVMERVVRKLFLHPAPTVALVNGHAVAGGCLVAQCCDVRIGIDEPSIRIGMTGVAIGLVYPPFVPAILGLRVPPPHLETVLMGSRTHAPAAALALGLLDEVVGRDAAPGVVSAHLAQRGQLPRHAYAAIKRALREPAFDKRADEHERFLREVLPTWTGALIRRIKPG